MDHTSEANPVCPSENTKFCKHCGRQIPIKAVICTFCGCQVEELKSNNQQPNVVINNTNTNTNVSRTGLGRARSKWIAFLLCLFLGYLGAHKFYEGQIGMGILYLLTAGIFGIGWIIGWIIDCIALLMKPDPYYV